MRGENQKGVSDILCEVYIYTEQNYKCNTLVFAPIFHELNSNI